MPTPERVQVYKTESTADGGQDAQNFPFPAGINPQQDALESAGLYVQDAANRDYGVLIFRDGSNLKFKDGVNPTPVSLTDMVTGGGGLTPGSHEIIDSLVHDLAETCYTEISRTSGRVASITVWTSPAKLIKVREAILTRTSGLVSQVVENQYDGAGVLVQTLTHVITRTGGSVTSITTTETLWVLSQ